MEHSPNVPADALGPLRAERRSDACHRAPRNSGRMAKAELNVSENDAIVAAYLTSPSAVAEL
jgi:hypothetical protein